MVNQLQLTLMVQLLKTQQVTAQLKPQGVSDNTFNASVVSQGDSVALSTVAGGVGKLRLSCYWGKWTILS